MLSLDILRFVSVYSVIDPSVYFLASIGGVPLPHLTDVQQFDGRSKIQSAKSKGLTGNAKYKLRKQEAIRETAEFLADTQQTEEALKTFVSSKKKDDLADSFLQGLRFLGGQG
jgi:hypothetical protein